jgi:hypothetical protein
MTPSPFYRNDLEVGRFGHSGQRTRCWSLSADLRSLSIPRLLLSQPGIASNATDAGQKDDDAYRSLDLKAEPFAFGCPFLHE